jgi:hypothetical protein
MFKRFSVQVTFKSGANAEMFTRAHTIPEALSQVLPLFSTTDTLISVSAKEAPQERASVAPPANGKGKRTKATSEGQATDKE